MLHGCAWIAGIGFTMSLFIAGLAFGATPRFDAARIGIVGASVAAAARRRADPAPGVARPRRLMTAPRLAHRTYLEMRSPDALRPAADARRHRRSIIAVETDCPPALLSPALPRHRRGVSLGRSRRVERPGHPRAPRHAGAGRVGGAHRRRAGRLLRTAGLGRRLDRDCLLRPAARRSSAAGWAARCSPRRVRRAWERQPTRVWLHTSSLDHPAALANYVARGFERDAGSRNTRSLNSG